MTGKKFTLRTAVAVSASCVLIAGPVGLASAGPGNNGHHHCGGNSGQGQGNQCDDDQVPPPGDEQVPPDNDDDQVPPPGDDQVPPDNGGDDQTPPGDNSDGDDHGTPPGNPGGDHHGNPGGDNNHQGPKPGDDHTPPGDNSDGDDHHQGPKPDGDDNHHGPKPGGDGHDSHPPKDGHHDVINVGVDIDLTVVVAPNVTVHFGDVTVNNYTIYQVNNVTTNNVMVNNQQYTEVTVYSVDTDVYYLGYYDGNGEFHCTGYYRDNVKTPEQANLALVNNDVVKEVPDVEVVTGVNPAAVTSSFWEDNLKWEVPLGIAFVAVAGYGIVTFVRRRNNGDDGPTGIPGASA